MAIVRSEKFIFVESKENHNKFWYIEEHDSGIIKTTYGRVGNTPTSTTKNVLNPSKEYDKLVKSKLKKGYVKLNTIDNIDENSNTIPAYNLESIALSEIEYDKSNNHIENMIKTFCQENIHNITSNSNIIFDKNNNVFQTPCGIITNKGIDLARAILSNIYDHIENKNFSNEFIKNVEEYCSIIPQKVHGKFNPEKIFVTKQDIEQQSSVLDSLENTLTVIENLKNSTDNHEKMFNVICKEITDKKIIKHITSLYENTKQSIHSSHRLKIKRIYSICIKSMETTFEKTKEEWTSKKINFNLKELWHGSRKANMISIFKNGMIIPNKHASHCTGRMFGNYLYFSDQSTKSLNYSYGWWNGHTRDNNCYMFLCDVLIGNAYTPGRSGCTVIPKGYNSIFAKGGISGVQNNEMMVTPEQVNPKYIIEFEG